MLLAKDRPALFTVLIFASLMVYGALRSPVPGVNEPHYLGKAKYIWNPQWCPNDFFFESSNPHFVFYQSVGQLTRFLTLPQTAWVGRVFATLILAIGWSRMVSRWCVGRWTGLWTTWAFLAFASIGSLSGEWIVGGVESKVFSYGFLFASLAEFADRRWNRAAALLGVAASFHPVIGIWGLIAVGFAIVILRFGRGETTTESLPQQTSQWKKRIVSIGLFVACSLPGLVPALILLGTSTTSNAAVANYIQVFYRLPHHLDPMKFSITRYACYAILCVLWLVARRRIRHSPLEKFFALFVIGSLVIALLGVAIGVGPRTASGLPTQHMPMLAIRTFLLKFYPFRLFDVMMPLAASVAMVTIAQEWVQSLPKKETRFGVLTVSLCLAGAATIGMISPAQNRQPTHMDERMADDWLEACDWIKQNTPADALFLTPPESWAFKWYAGRREFVSFKDCPQDSQGIVQWNKRLRYIRDWATATAKKPDAFSNTALLEFHEKSGVSHLLVRRFGPVEMDYDFNNGTYRVYDLSKLKPLSKDEKN